MKQVCFKIEDQVLQDIDTMFLTSGYPSRSELLRRLATDWRNAQLMRRNKQ